MNRQLILMRSVGSAVLLCLGPALPAYGVTLFSEDYEVNAVSDLTSNGWEVINNVDRDGSPTMAIVTAPAGRTGKVLRLQYQGIHDNDNRNAKITRYFTGVPEVYERYYVRYDPITAGASGFTPITAKQHFFNAGASAPAAISNYMWGEPRFIFGVNHTTAVTCPNGGTDITCNYYQNAASITMTPGVYWCVETHLKMNTPSASDGIVEVWINGIQTVNYPNVKFRDPATPSATFHSVQVYRQGSDNMYRYEDDYVLATTRVGCSGSPAPSDAQAPSVPANLSAQAASSSQINLTWNASVDNVGVTGYKIFRAGTQIATTAGTSYSDTGLAASTAYTYTVAAYDALGNVSAQSSPAASATTQAPPAALTCPTPGSGAFSACYFNNMTLDAAGLVLARTDAAVNFNWGAGSPAPAVNADGFSARWQGSFAFNAGDYTFSMTVDDGARLYIDGVLAIDTWINQAATAYSATRSLSAGTHLIKMEYYENGGEATAMLSWSQTGAPPAATDLNGDGVSNVTDVQLAVNQVLGISACTTGDVNKDGACNVTDVQKIVNAALGF